MKITITALAIMVFAGGQALAFTLKGPSAGTVDIKAEMEAARKAAAQGYSSDERPNRVQPEDPEKAETWQPAEERAEQMKLPQSKDAFWTVLAGAKIKYQEKEPYIIARLTDAIRTYDKKEVTVNGFMLPLDTYETTSHFLLSKYTPTCAFCPPGEPNEVIEVFTAKPVKVGYEPISLRGTFELINNTDQGIFFRLVKAGSIGT